jgi:hypothetical protein
MVRPFADTDRDVRMTEALLIIDLIQAGNPGGVEDVRGARRGNGPDAGLIVGFARHPSATHAMGHN